MCFTFANKMKSIVLTCAIVLTTFWTAHGKAYFYTRSELVQRSSAIAIIDISDPKETADSKNEYKQQANVKVVKLINGDLPDEFILNGMGSFICAQCILSKGRFLAFLRKDGDIWVGVNWQLSLRPIRDKEVEWYVTEEQRFPMQYKNLEEVLAEVQAIMQNPKSEQAAPHNR
jgi:hypothetical protein